jgi:2-polyprenyl-3-methyl-5-hydroxy-6-metoxy-1,4-benzoquinol methylase
VNELPSSSNIGTNILADYANQVRFWSGAFIKPLRRADCRTVLDLGCSTGNEVLGLTQEGFEVTDLDYSEAAICSDRSSALAISEGNPLAGD